MSDISAQTSAPRPFCLGRYLIDLPPGVEAFLPSASADYRFGTIQTERVQMTPKQFAERMEKREALYRGVDPDKKRSLSKSISPSPTSKIIINFEKIFGDDDYGFEAYKLDGNVLFSITQKNYDEAVMWKTVVPELQTRLLPSLRARAPDEIPTEPGLCIADGFIACDGSEKALEDVRIRLDSKRWPELFMSVVHHTVHKAEPSLLDRINKAEVPAEIAGLLGQIKHVREGRHDVGPITGEEMMVLLPTDYGFKNINFRWESHFVLNDPFKPMMVVELETGTKGETRRKPPTISEKDAIQLFDAIVNSIRLRPTGPAKRSEAPLTPKTPLGELVVTGRLCPETGWWHCADEGAPVLGGKRRYFRQGERMPDVVLQGEANLWQKMKGETPQFRRATVWTLSAYPDAPQEIPLGDAPQEVPLGEEEAAPAPTTDVASAALPDLAPPAPTDKT